MTSSAKGDSWQEGKTLVESHRHLFMHKTAADVTFDICYSHPSEPKRVNKVKVAAHKTILLCRSSVFYAMFCGEMPEDSDTVVVEDVEPEAFNEMLRFIYTDEVKLTENNVLFILYASKKYLVTLLTLKCLEYLENQMDATNAFDILDESLFFHENELVVKALQIIQDHTQEAFATEGFKTLSSNGLQILLNSNTLNCSESDVFEACMTWAAAECQRQKLVNNRENLRLVLGDMFYKIRFPTMSLEEFSTKVVTKNILTNEEGFQLYQLITLPDNLKPKDSLFLTVPRGISVLSNILLTECTNKHSVVIGNNVNQEFWFDINVSENLKLKSVYIFDVYNPSLNVFCMIRCSVDNARGNGGIFTKVGHMTQLQSTQTISEPMMIQKTKCHEIHCNDLVLNGPQHIVSAQGLQHMSAATTYKFHISIYTRSTNEQNMGFVFRGQPSQASQQAGLRIHNIECFSKGSVLYKNKELGIRLNSGQPIIVYGFKCEKV